MQCDAVLLGRAPSDGTIDASSLAALIRTFLLAKSFTTRRYMIRCRDARLEFLPNRTPSRRRRGGDDEGFESDDDDASSTKSLGSDSNSSSCCFVDDHVLKAKAVSSVGTDSANSSGASDTDDLEVSFARHVIDDTGLEAYSVSDVVFCHTDPHFPKVAVWVVKKPNSSGLETLVFECRSSENLKKLCASFQELSRRTKLDQYTHTNRRKVNPSTPLSAVLVKSLGPQNVVNTQQQTIIRTLKNTTDAITRFSIKENTPTFPKLKPVVQSTKPSSQTLAKCSHQDVLPLRAITKPHRTEEVPPMSRFNLVQRTDGDGVTHIEISRGAGPKDAIEDLSGPSSILSIHTPDVGNLLSTQSGVNKSRFSKEIESVIRSDVDVATSERKEVQRQRQPAILVLDDGNALRKVWAPEKDDKEVENPPMRPERRRYMKKKTQAPEPPKVDAKKKEADQGLKIKGTQFESRKGNINNNNSNQQKIVKGQFIRVCVDQPPRWGVGRRKSVDDIFAATQRRSKSPMAYRYVDAVMPQRAQPVGSTLSKRFFGVSQKLREFGGAAVRRNSLGELHHAQLLQQAASGGAGNLKSVIKKGNKTRMGEYHEPKKVTFSAYATVQVVD